LQGGTDQAFACSGQQGGESSRSPLPRPASTLIPTQWRPSGRPPDPRQGALQANGPFGAGGHRF
jgi:hypothetical protein